MTTPPIRFPFMSGTQESEYLHSPLMGPPDLPALLDAEIDNDNENVSPQEPMSHYTWVMTCVAYPQVTLKSPLAETNLSTVPFSGPMMSMSVAGPSTLTAALR